MHRTDTVGSLGESALVERIRRRAGTPPSWITHGIGDDAAVIEPERGALQVVTTDALIEGVHFRREWTPMRATGRKALGVNLSDLAAMGALPRASFLSLALRPDFSITDFDDLLDGFLALAGESRTPLAGGNIARSTGPLVIDVTVVGAARRRRLLTRSGGRPGDALYVTGLLGAAAAGLALLQASVNREKLTRDELECLARYEQPEPRLRCGVQIARNRVAVACVDLSDGLADGARQLAQASQTGVLVEAEQIPIHPGAVAWAAKAGRDPLPLALAGGEDYELLFAVPPRQEARFLTASRRCGGLPVRRIGWLTAQPDLHLSRGGHLEPLGEGFQHFSPLETRM